nr:MAG TPA: hypothetical protein [Caudoviricetes sp.]
MRPKRSFSGWSHFSWAVSRSAVLRGFIRLSASSDAFAWVVRFKQRLFFERCHDIN